MKDKSTSDKTINILVFPCGTEIGLEIYNSLKYVKQIKLFGASSIDDHGKIVFKKYIGGLPFISEKNFISKINKIIEKDNIDFIFPAHDSVVLFLAKNAKKLSCETITSDYKTCSVCRSKSKSYKLFPRISPRLYDSPNDVKRFPVFLKPDVGQGSQGAVRVDGAKDLEFYTTENKESIILEYLPGKEYTVDCFTDRKGVLLFTGMRERIRTRNGISVNSKTMPTINKQVSNIAKNINNKLRFRGVWFFQVKLDCEGRFKLLEIAPRVAGTMCLYRNNGINFELLSIFDRLGYDISILDNKMSIEVDRALVNRFSVEIEYNTVYIDFDDTLVLRGRVNEFLMSFIYQCLNNDKRIVLITKHDDDISESLEKYKISRNIFSEIIHICKNDEKNDYIKSGERAIFIDDSFSERMKAKEKLNIPCFDIDAVESLIDWKR